jgi:hypothetical protein
MNNRRGQELSTNTVIILVLAVLVLVFIIIGFSVGWNKIFPFISPGNNVKDVADKCSLACSTEAKYDYCTSVREVKVESNVIFSAGGKQYDLTQDFKGTCLELANVPSLGIDSCGKISCSDVVYSSEAYASLACDNLQKTGLSNPVKLKYLNNGQQTELTCSVQASQQK